MPQCHVLFHECKENSLEHLLGKFVKIKSSYSYTDKEIKAQMLNEFPTVTKS